ncbi:MAG: hypothetical protein V2A34_13460 [Lentisphaerota bacterium]
MTDSLRFGRSAVWLAVLWLYPLVGPVDWAVASPGNELKNGSFDAPDDEWWAGSSWSIWTDPDVCGRPWWAERTHPQEWSGRRGAAAFGWENANEMGLYQDVAGGAHVVYTFTVWVRKERNYNEDFTQLNIEWLDRNRNWLGGNICSNITGRASNDFTRFTVTGSTTNTHCAIVRAVIWAKWKTPTNTSTVSLQFDDAELTARPPTIIRIK